VVALRTTIAVAVTVEVVRRTCSREDALNSMITFRGWKCCYAGAQLHSLSG
jgi:hypothetical protein